MRDIAAVFAHNGQNVQGDLKPVVKATLTHPEAQAVTATTGKLSEPALFFIRQLRAHFVACLVSGGFGDTVRLRTASWLAPAQATENPQERVMTVLYLSLISSQFQIGR